MLLALLKWALKRTTHDIMMTLLRIFSTIPNIRLHITLLIMVLSCTAIQYPIKVASILGILDNTFPDTTSRRGTDGQTQNHEGGT